MNKRDLLDSSKIIIVEGPDRTGKSTLVENLRKSTDFSCLIIDRLFISNIVYRRLRLELKGYSDVYINSVFEKEFSEVKRIIENFPVPIYHIFLTGSLSYINGICDLTNHKKVPAEEIELFSIMSRRLNKIKNSVAQVIDVTEKTQEGVFYESLVGLFTNDPSVKIMGEENGN